MADVSHSQPHGRSSTPLALGRRLGMLAALLGALALGLPAAAMAAEALEVKELEATATPATAGATNASYELSFIASDPIPSGGYIQFTAPAGAVLPSSGEAYELDYAGQSLEPSEVALAPEGFGPETVRLTLSEEVGASEEVQVRASGVSNPPSANASAKVALITSADSEPAIWPLPVGPATAAERAPLEVTGGPRNAGAEKAVYDISLTPTQTIPSGGLIELTGPAEFRFPFPTELCCFRHAVPYELIDHGEKSVVSEVVVPPSAPEAVELQIPFEVKAGELVEVRGFGAGNPPQYDASGELSVSIPPHEAPSYSYPLPIGRPKAVGGLSASASTTAANAKGVVYQATFRPTTALLSHASQFFSEPLFATYWPIADYVNLTGPDESVLDSQDPKDGSGEFRGGAGFPENPEDYEVKSETASGTDTGISPFVLDAEPVFVYIPAGVVTEPGAPVTVTVRDVTNPPVYLPRGTFTIHTSEDATPVSVPFPIEPPAAEEPPPSSGFGTTTSVVASASPVVFGQPLTLRATVHTAPERPIAKGRVKFYAGKAEIGHASLGAGGSASLTTSTLAAGTHEVTATYIGVDSNHPSSAPFVSVRVQKALTTTALTSSPDPSTVGQQVTFTAAVSPPSSAYPTPTGTVRFKEGQTVLGTVALDGTGEASIEETFATKGVHRVRAEYLGDVDYGKSFSTFVQTVQPDD